MLKSTLVATVETENVEYELLLPENTVRVEVQRVDAFPVRVDFIQGRVLSSGILLASRLDTGMLRKSVPSLFYSSQFPGASITVHCWHSEQTI